MTAMAHDVDSLKFPSVTLAMDEGPLVLDYGRIYLIEQERMDKAVEIISRLSRVQEDIVCVSRMHPGQVMERWPLAKMTSYWLSQREGPWNIPPERLDRVKEAIADHLLKGINGVAILDGLEYLGIHNDFREINLMFEELNDLVMETRSILLIPLDPRLLEPLHLARLRRFAELVL
ncbi:MAG: hypothetical protein A4E32_01361 [Methanomassiliicoccales archaeon PtaU1.Bin124]|nr:MAG: hypothetical protein A4E32_01361 [Methanomassiliicoccales archaeon PtaU1.Bin124]